MLFCFQASLLMRHAIHASEWRLEMQWSKILGWKLRTTQQGRRCSFYLVYWALRECSKLCLLGTLLEVHYYARRDLWNEIDFMYLFQDKSVRFAIIIENISFQMVSETNQILSFSFFNCHLFKMLVGTADFGCSQWFRHEVENEGCWEIGRLAWLVHTLSY